MLTKSETQALLLAVARGGSATEQEREAAVEWARQTSLAHELLGLVLRGQLAVQMRSGRPFFLGPSEVEREEAASCGPG